MNPIDLSPTIIELDDGKVGYFYSLTQLEEIEHRQLMQQTPQQIRERFNGKDIENILNKHKNSRRVVQGNS